MKKALVIFLLLLGCTPSYHKSIRSQKSCLDQLEFVHPKYRVIDSLLQSKGLQIENADSVFQIYKDRILEYFSGNNEAFREHDTISLGICYQTHNRISCTSIYSIDTTIKDKIIKELNKTAFPGREEFDSSFAYCIRISGKIISSSKHSRFTDVNYNIATIGSRGRSKASIMRTVMQFLANMRYAYNTFLREKPGLKGRITIKFAINQDGTVIYARILNSTIEYCKMEKKELDIIVGRNFGKIDAAHDLTTVVYPFVFSFGNAKQKE